MWTACVGIGIHRITKDNLVAKNIILVITDKVVYWLAMLCAIVVLCGLPMAAKAYVQSSSVSNHDKVPRARQSALAIVLCVLDVYTLYLVHEVTVTVADWSDNEPNSTFGDRWHQSTSIPANITSACDVEDVELKTYGLLYQNQVSNIESQRFMCSFELHEAIRLNLLCSVVAWTIYRMSTHNRNRFGLLVTGMVFLAVTTTVDDLRSYWVLGLEQAAFLSVAALLETVGGFERKEVTTDTTVTESGVRAGELNDSTVQSLETAPFLMPRPGNQNRMRLDF